LAANPRKLAFVLAATDQGTYLVNRFDYNGSEDSRYGVGHKLLQFAAREPQEVDTAIALLSWRRDYFGPGVVGIDCGANLGIHSVSWARHMTGWGSVLAIEAQERIFYALCGNITLNNVFNARAMHAAVAAEVGRMRIPVPDYLAPASFGSLELKPLSAEFIGQNIDYAESAGMEIDTITIDSLNLPRVDFIKIDVEGMELEVLAGAQATLNRCKPVLLIDRGKVEQATLRERLTGRGYVVFEMGINVVAVHGTDRTLEHLRAPPVNRVPESR